MTTPTQPLNAEEFILLHEKKANGDLTHWQVQWVLKAMQEYAEAYHASRLDAAAKELPSGEYIEKQIKLQSYKDHDLATENNCISNTAAEGICEVIRDEAATIIARMKQEQEQDAIGFGKFVTDFFSMRLQVEEIKKLHAHYLREKQKGENKNG